MMGWNRVSSSVMASGGGRKIVAEGRRVDALSGFFLLRGMDRYTVQAWKDAVQHITCRTLSLRIFLIVDEWHEQ